MKTTLSPWQVWRLLPCLIALLFCPPAQAALIDNYTGLTNALAASQVVTGFLNGAIISVGSGQTIQITRDTVIDAGNANLIIDGGNVARLFRVAPNVQLTLANVQLYHGYGTFGGAVYNQGTLIVSNCVFYGNNATNVPGLAGDNGVTNAIDGGNGADGGNVWGAAIYSAGPLYIYNSLFTTNAALAGVGGSGGSGINVTGQAFAGAGGDAGNGGSAEGGAVFSAGPTNVIYDSEFLGNTCVAGGGGAGGPQGINAEFYYYDGSSGQGGAGGPALGGGVYILGALSMSNCLFFNNAAFAGASTAAAGAFNGSGNNGATGGAASGGGLFVSGSSPSALIENSTFFENSCVAGAGGNASATASAAGNGGAATGGGVSSQSAATLIESCTLATNTLLAGAAGQDSGTNGDNGTVGAAQGAQDYRGAGAAQIKFSLLSGKGGNSYSVSDAGYNMTSDATPGRLYASTTLNANPRLDSVVTNNGGPNVGPAGVTTYPRWSLAIVQGSPAAGALPGVPGVTFPATDERGLPRPATASIGAYELNVLTVTQTPPPQITLQPATQLAFLGQPAYLSVNATADPGDTNALGYQWQLNGANLTESANFLNVNSSNLTILHLTQADLGAYTVVISPSVLDSVTNSATAYLEVNIPTVIKRQPASQLGKPNGSVINFNVSVSGSPPFYYQWLLNGAPLTDTNEFSGSATSNLTVNPATIADAGSYQVVISNYSHTVTSAAAKLTIVPDNVKPHFTITTPAANARTTNGIVAGLATDNAQVTTVNFWVTNIFEGMSSVIATNAALTSPGTTEVWAVSNIFLPGTNIVAAQAVDYAGNVSAVVTRRFFYIVPSYFGLSTHGTGTVTGRTTIAGTTVPTDGAMLNIGQTYILTAKPGPYYLLTNWTSPDFTVYSNTLVFTMTPNLNVEANFVLSPFLSAGGPYNGLFYETNGVATETAGMLSNLKVGLLGAYTGKLLLGGVPYSLAGTFNIFGAATNRFSRAAAKGGSFEVDLNLDWNSGQVSGSVAAQNGAWQSSLYAEANNLASGSAESTMLLTTSTNGAGTAPSGDGYVLITNRAGNLTMTGALPDGTTFSQTVPLGKYDNVPLYQSLSAGAGLVLGWVNLTDALPEASDGLSWIRPAAHGVFYPAGFSNTLNVDGSPWVNDIFVPSATLVVSNESVNVPYQVSIANDALTDSTDNPPVKGTINPKTGLITLKIPSGRGTITGYAAILANSTNIGGYFLTKTNTGVISLQP